MEAYPIQLSGGCYLDFHKFGQRIDDRSADAVQSSGEAIGIVIKLAACVELCIDHLDA